LKGQIFIADVLASLLVVTVIVAFATWELEQIYGRASDIEYEKISALASDISQMAVKSILANSSKNVTYPNWIDPDKWTLLRRNMSRMIPSPYAYEAKIFNSNLTTTGNGGCALKQNVAAVRRIVYINGTVQEFSVKVCV
jgi:hypothetical protein